MKVNRCNGLKTLVLEGYRMVVDVTNIRMKGFSARVYERWFCSINPWKNGRNQ